MEEAAKIDKYYILLNMMMSVFYVSLWPGRGTPSRAQEWALI